VKYVDLCLNTCPVLLEVTSESLLGAGILEEGGIGETWETCEDSFKFSGKYGCTVF